MANQIGVAFQLNKAWKVECLDGSIYDVVGGQYGDIHPVLYRGRDENTRVEFTLTKDKKAEVWSFAPPFVD